MKYGRIQIIFFAALPLSCLLLMGMASAHRFAKPCKAVDIHIQSGSDNLFLDRAQVEKLVGVNENLLNTALQDMSLDKVERQLKSTNYVESIDAYFNADDHLSLDLQLRQPIARVIDNRNGGFYFDAKRIKIPLCRQFTSRVLLLRGAFHESTSALDTLSDSVLISLVPMLKYIQADPFLKAMIAEIDIDKTGDLTLYPEVGNVPFLFGQAENYVGKLEALTAFCKNVMGKVGWDYYRAISLKYKGQIIGIKS